MIKDHKFSQILKSLAFIAGYSVHKYLNHDQPCHVCFDTSTFEKEFVLNIHLYYDFKLLKLTDRGGRKYPSEPVLSSIITLWRIFVTIENKNKLLVLLVYGLSRLI